VTSSDRPIETRTAHAPACAFGRGGLRGGPAAFGRRVRRDDGGLAGGGGGSERGKNVPRRRTIDRGSQREMNHSLSAACVRACVCVCDFSFPPSGPSLFSAGAREAGEMIRSSTDRTTGIDDDAFV
jgi:hypothetical protein